MPTDAVQSLYESLLRDFLPLAGDSMERRTTIDGLCWRWAQKVRLVPAPLPELLSDHCSCGHRREDHCDVGCTVRIEDGEYCRCLSFELEHSAMPPVETESGSHA